MFVGQYPVRLDAKNRVIVPQRLRESQIEGGPLWSKFYLTLGTEACIAVYTPEGWQQLMQEMGATKSVVDESVRILQRLTAANVDMRECDAQGRIVLSDQLRRQAGITRDLIWIGAVSRAEIWNPERWAAFNRKHIAELGEKMDIVSRAGLALPDRNDHLRRGPQG
jgi:MraZ protein